MYLHIGNEVVVPFKEIIAILNLNTTARSTINEGILTSAEGYKSCIITNKNIYFSTISSGTLMKRAVSFPANLEE
ncbi:MAG: extracellular matrix regulator RemB [Moorella sp. (in: firmicutes)]